MMRKKERERENGPVLPWEHAGLLGILLDATGRIIDCNVPVETVTGWKRKQLLGRNFTDVFRPERERKPSRLFPDFPDRFPETPFKLRFKNRWQTEKTVLWTGGRLQDAEASPAYFLAGVDITKQSEAERKRLKLQERVALGKREWRTIFDGITDMLMILKSDFTIQKANRATTELLGMPAEKILGKRCCDLCQTEKTHVLSCPVSRSIQLKTPLSGEVYSDRIGKHLLVTSYPILDPRGKVASLIVYHKDITQVRKTQEKLEKTNSLLRALIDASESAVLMTDETGQVIVTNRKFYELFHIEDDLSLKSREDIQHTLSRVMLNPEDFDRKFRFIQAHRMEHITDEIEIVTQEEEKTLLRQTVPVTDTKGNFIGQLELYTDITKLKRSLLEASHTEKLVALGEMVAGVAHELNNPLATISGFSQLLLLKQNLEEEIRQDVEKIASECERARRIVENLLAFARAQEPEMTEVYLPDVMENTLNLLAYELREAGITVIKRYEETLPLVRGDPTQFQQVFLNILKNAIYELKKLNRERALTLVMRRRGSSVEIRIKDSGPGIDRTHLKRIFEPFFTTKPTGEGTGLGLSVSFGIIHQHGGTIYARNRTSGGAEFVIRLPVAAPRADRPESTHPDKTSPGESPSLSGNVLVVDDEDFILQLLRRFFEREGMKVLTARDGEEAASWLDHPFDLIILDLVMPGMSGDKLFESLKNQGNPNVEKILFLTGDSVDPATLSFLQSTGRPWLFKPFKLAELKRKALEILRQNR